MLPMDRHFVLVGSNETAVNVPDAGAIFISRFAGLTVVEAVAHSGPGVAARKAILEAACREAGLGEAIDDGRRRAAMPS